jgi:hypothetical protein
VDYVFELDLKDTDNVEGEQSNEVKETAGPFFANLEDWSLFKLRSTLFLIDFPLSFTISIVNVWMKNMPNPTLESGYSKDEIDQINVTKQVIRDFFNGIIEHLKSLQTYLAEIKGTKFLVKNYKLIQTGQQFKDLKSMLTK